MRICKVQIAIGRNFQGIKSGITQLKPGDPCDPSWGGGVVASLVYDRDYNSVLVRKDCPFRHQDGKMPAFDVLAIPFALVEAVALLDQPEESRVSAPPASLPSCSKCGGNSGGKPLCGTCHAAEKAAKK
jgi:hypothetical protein